MGSLPELQQKLGPSWVHLYDGELTPGILAGFVQTLRAERPYPTADLSAFEWPEIGRQLANGLEGYLVPLRVVRYRPCLG